MRLQVKSDPRCLFFLYATSRTFPMTLSWTLSRLQACQATKQRNCISDMLTPSPQAHLLTNNDITLPEPLGLLFGVLRGTHIQCSEPRGKHIGVCSISVWSDEGVDICACGKIRMWCSCPRLSCVSALVQEVEQPDSRSLWPLRSECRS